MSDKIKIPWKEIAIASTLTAAVGAGVWISKNFHVAPTNAFLTKIGPGVRDINIGRKFIRLPFQQIQSFDMNPRNMRFNLHNMSSEKVEFELPTVFTIAPAHPVEDPEGFKTYVTRVGNMSEEEIVRLIEGVVNGETRILTAGLTIEDMFKNREHFNDTVVEKIQPILNQYGIKIQNANIAEMKDMNGNKYFENLKQRALEQANTTARISVAEAKKIGDIGQKDKETETRQKVSIMEATAVTTENLQRLKISESQTALALAQTELEKSKKLALLNAQKETETNRIMMESELARKNQEQELEALRATEVSKAVAQGEAKIRIAEAEANAVRIRADAQKYSAEQEALGIKALLDAKAEGLRNVSSINSDLAKFYLALEGKLFDRDGIYGKMSEEQAKALQNLNPDIRIWNTGGDSGITSVFQDLVKASPPLIDAFQQQTGLKFKSD